MPPADANDSSTSWVLTSVVTRLIVWGSAFIALAIYAYAANWFSIPFLSGYSASLLEGAAFSNFVVIVTVYISIVAVASALAGQFKPGLGVFAASFGLAAISFRGGTVSTLLRSSSSNVYLMLLLETVLLATLTAAGAAVQGFLVPKPPIKVVEEEDIAPDLMAKLLSVGVQTGVTVLLVWLLGSSDNKGQALAAAGIASLLGTLAADNALPVGLTPLAVMAPFVAAVIGYAWASINITGTRPANALVIALPLDYASFGVAGTMMAHWISQQWRDEAAEEESP